MKAKGKYNRLEKNIILVCYAIAHVEYPKIINFRD